MHFENQRKLSRQEIKSLQKMASEKQGCHIKEHLKKPLKLTKMIYKFYTAPITKFWFYLVKILITFTSISHLKLQKWAWSKILNSLIMLVCLPLKMRIFFPENIIDYHTRELILASMIDLSDKDTYIRFPFLTVRYSFTTF